MMFTHGPCCVALYKHVLDYVPYVRIYVSRVGYIVHLLVRSPLGCGLPCALRVPRLDLSGAFVQGTWAWSTYGRPLRPKNLRRHVLKASRCSEDFLLRAMEISEACLLRHATSPQCNYHLGVASMQLAFLLQQQGMDCKAVQFQQLRGRALREFTEARRSSEARGASASGKRRKRRAWPRSSRRPGSPWTTRCSKPSRCT